MEVSGRRSHRVGFPEATALPVQLHMAHLFVGMLHHVWLIEQAEAAAVIAPLQVQLLKGSHLAFDSTSLRSEELPHFFLLLSICEEREN